MISKFKCRKYIGLLFISPFIVSLIIFQIYPFLSSLLYSFTDLSIANNWEFIGLENYKHMLLDDREFWNSLKVTFIYVLFAVPGKLIFALFIAMLLNMKIKGIGLFRTIYYIPSILGGSVAVSVMWRFLFANDGIINLFLSRFNIEPIQWLGSPKVAIYTISMLAIWQFGSSMILFLAGLKQIPTALYEAAAVDGASKIRQFFCITLPMLTPIVLFNIIMQTISAFQEFTSAFVITGGGPMKSTYLYGLMLYQNSFQYFKMGYSSAQSWVLFLIILVITGVIFKSASYWTHYEDGGEF